MLISNYIKYKWTKHSNQKIGKFRKKKQLPETKDIFIKRANLSQRPNNCKHISKNRAPKYKKQKVIKLKKKWTIQQYWETPIPTFNNGWNKQNVNKEIRINNTMNKLDIRDIHRTFYAI